MISCLFICRSSIFYSFGGGGQWEVVFPKTQSSRSGFVFAAFGLPPQPSLLQSRWALTMKLQGKYCKYEFNYLHFNLALCRSLDVNQVLVQQSSNLCLKECYYWHSSVSKETYTPCPAEEPIICGHVGKGHAVHSKRCCK